MRTHTGEEKDEKTGRNSCRKEIAAVKNLNVGDKIDMEGFLYWYEGVNPHITSVTAAK